MANPGTPGSTSFVGNVAGFANAAPNPSVADRIMARMETMRNFANPMAQRMYGNMQRNNALYSRGGLLGGALAAGGIPAMQSFVEGRALEGATTMTGTAAGVGLTNQLTQGIKNPLARMGANVVGGMISGAIGQGLGEAAENVKAGITGKDPAGKTSASATRTAMQKDAEAMAAAQNTLMSGQLQPYIAANKDLMEYAMNQRIEEAKRMEPIANRMQNQMLVRQQAINASNAQNYMAMGTVATAGQLATGAQQQAGANFRTAITANPYAANTLQAPNINFGR